MCLMHICDLESVLDINFDLESVLDLSMSPK